MRSVLLISLVLALAATYVSAITGPTQGADPATTAAPQPTDGGTGGGDATTAAPTTPAPTTPGSSGYKDVASLTTFALAALLGRLLV
jgi:hypothetical protein